MSEELDAKIRALDGLTVAGGCDHCEAVQEVQASHYGRSAHRIVVIHEADCPVHGIPAAFRKN